MNASSSRSVPFGVVMPGGGITLVSGASGSIEMLDSETGRLLAEVSVDATPIAAEAATAVAVRVTTPTDPGEVILLTASAEELTVVNRTPLLDAESHASIAPWITETVTSRATIDAAEAIVNSEVTCRYQGAAAPSDELLAEANTIVRVRVVVDAETSERLTTRRNPDESKTDELGTAPVADEGQVATSVQAVPDFSLNLESGATNATLIEDRVVYQVVEYVPDRSEEHHYLRSVDVDANGPVWSRLMRVISLQPEPPPPP